MGSQKVYLYFFFITAAMFLLIHLLNMLIAIMGDSFMRRKEYENSITTRNNLRFVIDNWHVIDWALKDKQKVKYIIAAIESEY